MSLAVSAPAADSSRSHPTGLYVLFFTEMWERFSYYGMRSLLVLYMTQHLLVGGHMDAVWGLPALKAGLETVFGPLESQALSSQIYGLYTGFVYFTPFFGGILADRYLGQRRTVVVGGLLMAVGHFLMAFESLFLPAMFFLILGNGAFKPNISTQVGRLYAPDDTRRDRAFGIFYVGINLGAFFSPLVCGTLGQRVGFHSGFAAAGVGMLIGLVVYLAGQKHLAPEPTRQHRDASASQAQPLSSAEKKAIGALVLLCVLNVVFWAVYEQQGNTLQLWAENNTDMHVLGGLSFLPDAVRQWEMPSTWYQSFNPFMIFALTPAITGLWSWQGRKGSEPSSVGKMAIGCLLVAVSFGIMLVAARAVGGGGAPKASILWLAVSTLVLTIGELYLSPVGLSLVTKVAPARMVSMLMGMWFLSSFFGNYLSGLLGSFYETMGKETFFLLLAVLAAAAGGAMLLLIRPLKKAMGTA